MYLVNDHITVDYYFSCCSVQVKFTFFSLFDLLQLDEFSNHNILCGEDRRWVW